MKLANQTFVPFVLVLTILTLLIGCGGGTQKPSASVISKLVEENLSKGVPASWVEARFWTTQATIKKIKIEEWGKFNEARKYWPAKIRVVGTAKAEMGFFEFEDRDFDVVAEFIFSQDDFGKWQCSRK
ncbi:hypothetical protein C6501_06050 [Candidatus Poribacteria bacterium]|nr:MAG: hypothetical protein C6501_06050 [Candidatus Poribacteria bacterium]